MHWICICRLDIVSVSSRLSTRSQAAKLPLFHLSIRSWGFEACLRSSSRSGKVSTVRVVFDPFHSKPLSHKNKLRLKTPLVASRELPSKGFFSSALFSVDSRTSMMTFPSHPTANKIVTSRLWGMKDSVRIRARSRRQLVPKKRHKTVDGRRDRICSRCDR